MNKTERLNGTTGHAKCQAGTPALTSKLPLLGAWILGTLGIAYSQGHFPSPLLAVVGVASWLWFVRHAHIWLALILVTAGNIIAWEIAYREMIPLPTAARFGLEFGMSLLLAFVFLIDRWARLRLAGRVPGLLLTFVFPCGWVAIDLLNARVSPGATWASIAYSFGDSPLVHVAAFVGWTGLTFLIGWLAVLLCTVADRQEPARRRWWAVGIGTAVATALSLFGVTRQHTGQFDLPVSLIVAPDTYKADRYLNEVWAYTRGVEQSPADSKLARDQLALSREQHFQMVRREAEQGSRLIVWAEANASITAHEEPVWVGEAATIAKEFGVYVGMGLMVFHPEPPLSSQNKFILVDPTGQIVCDFLKRTRPPGVSHEIGSGRLPLIDTEFGTWTTAICYDMDFPQLIHPSAGKADLLLAPSNDWTAAAATHSRMAHIRAVESGCCLARPTKDGISSVVDSCGRVLASQVTDGSPQSVLRCRLPVGRSWTFYPHIGDAFAWLCSLAWLATIVALVVDRVAKRRS